MVSSLIAALSCTLDSRPVLPERPLLLLLSKDQHSVPPVVQAVYCEVLHGAVDAVTTDSELLETASKTQTPPQLLDLLPVGDEDEDVMVGTGVKQSRRCGLVAAEHVQPVPVTAAAVLVTLLMELLGMDSDGHAAASAWRRGPTGVDASKVATRRARWRRRRRRLTVVV